MSTFIRTAHQIDALNRTDDVKVNTSDNVYFSNMMLSPHVLQGLSNAGFVRPSPIQLEAIPVGRCGLDLIVQAKSGTGKTCVFTVIALESLNIQINAIQVLVLAPTREIVVQISEVIKSVGSAIPALKCRTFIGGISVSKDRLSVRNCHIAVGTPGRIKQLIKEKILKLDSVRLFVLDEADKLVDENFQKDINWIYNHLPSNKQMIALSATYPEDLAQFLTRYMQTPTFARLNTKDPALLGIKQFYKTTPYHPLEQKRLENKIPHLLEILNQLQFRQCLIFSNYQMRAKWLCLKLAAHGWPATYINGKMEQDERLAVMTKMKKFQCRVLVTTDLTARGIDLLNVNLVINLDVPLDFETYLHRVGRAGRFGSAGIAITLVESSDALFLELWPETFPGNLYIKKLIDDNYSELWSVDTSTSNNDLEPLSSISDEAKQESSEENNHYLFGHDTAVGAGLIETLKHEENIRKETVGHRQKLGKRKLEMPSQSNTEKSSIDCVDISTDVRQMLMDDQECLRKYEEITVSDDERDLLNFLSETDGTAECDFCKPVNKIELTNKRATLEPPSKGIKSFLQNLHSTFFDNLKKDLKPVLDLDRDEGLKSELDEWMALLHIKEDSGGQKLMAGPQIPKHVPPMSAITTTIKNTVQKPKKISEEQRKFKANKRQEPKLMTEANTGDNKLNCEINKKCFDGNNLVGDHINADFNEWYRSVQSAKYCIWYEEYTKFMLGYK